MNIKSEPTKTKTKTESVRERHRSGPEGKTWRFHAKTEKKKKKKNSRAYNKGKIGNQAQIIASLTILLASNFLLLIAFQTQLISSPSSQSFHYTHIYNIYPFLKSRRSETPHQPFVFYFSLALLILKPTKKHCYN